MDYYEGLQRVIKGKAERIWSEYRDSNYQLIDPTNPKLDIYTPSGLTVIASATPTKESTGVYYYTVSLSTSSSVEEGMYSAYWYGTIGGALISMDVPQYFWVQQVPWVQNDGANIVASIRRFIGDTNPNNYRIATQDIHYFLSDAVKQVQTVYNMGYSITVTPASVTFNKAMSITPETLFVIKSAELIMRSVLTDVLFSGANLSLGDIKINMADTIRARRDYVRDLELKFNDLVKKLKMATNVNSGVLINNYLLENQVKYNLNYVNG